MAGGAIGASLYDLETGGRPQLAALSGYPLRIVGRVPLVTAPTSENAAYLSTKQAKLGHWLAVDAAAAVEARHPHWVPAPPQRNN